MAGHGASGGSRGRAQTLEIEARHLRDLSQAAAGLAHETRNPLGLIRGWTQRLAETGEDSADSRKQAQAVIEECDRVTARINQFLAFARPSEPKPERFDRPRWSANWRCLLEPDLDAKQSDLASVARRQHGLRRPGDVPPGPCSICCKMPSRPAGERRPWKRRSLADATDDCGLKWRIEDRACRARSWTTLFTPYFTTRAGGTGLGLAIVRRIAAAHGWDVRLHASPRGRRHFLAGWNAWLTNSHDPDRGRRSRQQRRAGRVRRVAGLPCGRGRPRRKRLWRSIRSHAPRHGAARRAVARHERHRRPGAKSARLADDCPCCLITAYADLRQAVAAVKSGADDYLAKPVDLDELEAAITDAVGPVGEATPATRTASGAAAVVHLRKPADAPRRRDSGRRRSLERARA